MVKQCTKMEMAIKLNFTTTNLIFNVVVNVTIKLNGKHYVTFAFVKFFSIYLGWVSFTFAK